MIKIAILGALVAASAAVGYFVEPVLRGEKAPSSAQMEEKPALLFKLPLGKFTTQILMRENVLHVVFDMDVYVVGAEAFERTNGALGVARLRDATVRALSELIETNYTFADMLEAPEGKAALAEMLVRKLYRSFPEIRTARINTLQTSVTDRSSG
jgi:hypothetical protein